MFEYFTAFGLSASFTKKQITNFKIYNTASLQSFVLLDNVENEVACAVNNIKTNCAPGPNGILPKFF